MRNFFVCPMQRLWVLFASVLFLALADARGFEKICGR